MAVLKQLTVLQLTALFLAFLLMFFSYWILSFVQGNLIQKSEAFTFGMPFGGPIMMTEACCNGLKVTVDNYNPMFQGQKKLMLMPGLSRIFMNYRVMPGSYTVGDALPAGICVKPFTFPPCTSSESVDGTIMMIGTN